tara:strand:- start:29202 stop:30677 length:1476 start_codon:yes stop_codon:yes gene_type:complete
MADIDNRTDGDRWRWRMTRPAFLAAGMVLLAVLLSLLALVYLAWASTERLAPLERHLTHLQNLHNVSLDIQSALLSEISHKDRPDAKAVEKISQDLQKILKDDGHLHVATPQRIMSAQRFLVRDGYSIEENLAAANQVMEEALRQENEVQRVAITQTRATAQRELMIAIFSLIAVPTILLVALAIFRRRYFSWSASLSEMLENVRNSKLDQVELPAAGTPIYPVIKHYNAMVVQLREVEQENAARQQNLEHQVQVASDSLIRVQRHLAQAEQLSAIGEFSARVAHELRNPLSGITVALRNLREDIVMPDKIEVIDLILDELERVNRLLNGLLARTPNMKETLSPGSVAGLCRDMITLFGYESDQPIAFELNVPDTEVLLPQDSLRQAILNILRNSAQAMGKAGGKIVVDGEIADGRMTLAFEDSGPGYPEDILRNGIRPFNTDKEGGSGLGLSILQRLIDNLGGTLRLEQAQGGGARTVIALPCHPSSAEE